MQVYLAEVAGLPGYGDQVMEVAVKQLRCKWPRPFFCHTLKQSNTLFPSPLPFSPPSTPPVSDFIARHGHHSQQMEDFLREAKEMSKVDYPTVVKLMAVCTL